MGSAAAAAVVNVVNGSLGKMKQLVADKLVVSLLGGVERKGLQHGICLPMFWGTWMEKNAKIHEF